jgi:hypothetical protein
VKTILLYTSIAFTAGLVRTNAYNSVVDANNGCSNIPTSIEQARDYFSVVNPGGFLKPLAPLNLAFLVLVLILFWNAGDKVRMLLSAA